MDNAITEFEEKCSELSKKFFSGLAITQKEHDAHTIYWQYVQVTNRGFRPWLLDCEKDEAKNTLHSLHRVGLAEVAQLTEEAIELLSAPHSTETADSEQIPSNTQAPGFAAMEQHYSEWKPDIVAAVQRYLEE
ncbi:MAG: DUF4375 domain-containing protein [Halieaceae bacterium]|jgi:hypothetical protein|nr:DUF4375 domain-containing protein [Halieaceae bacterium]